MSRPAGNNVEIQVLDGDITAMDFDVLVLPTTTTGAAVTRPGKKYVEKGGDAIEKEAMEVAPIAIGAALVTEAGKLKAKNVIHVPVALTPGAKIGVENVRRATRAALVAANAKNFSAIAFPPMCVSEETGIPSIEIARAMLDEVRGHRHPKPEQVFIVDDRGEVARMARKIIDALK